MSEIVKDERGYPVVFTYKITAEQSYNFNSYNGYAYQYLPTCPFCGHGHRHLTSKDDKGLRLSHCVGKDRKHYRLALLGNAPENILWHYQQQFYGGDNDAKS